MEQFAQFNDRNPVVWRINRYHEVMRVLKSPKAFSSDRPLSFSPDALGYRFVLFCQDPPAHSQLRKRIQKSFTSARLESIQTAVEIETDNLLDLLPGLCSEQHSGLTTDIASSLALPLPILIIVRMLGVATSHCPRVKRWTEEAVGHHDGIADTASPGRRAFIQMHVFFREQMALKRRCPDDGLISLLLEECEDELEVINFCVTLLIAGNETTASLISNLLSILAAKPGLWERLRADRALVDAVIEETLRFDSPIQCVSRRVSKQTELGGRRMEPGDELVASLGEANRDPEVFSEPDTFIPDRPERAHLAFSHGIHFCVGASLSRMEARIVLNRMLDRFRSISPAGPGVRYPNRYFRGFCSLPLRLS